MASVSALVSSLINMAASLLPEVKNTFFAASSSSSAQAPDAHALEAELKRLMRMLERIKATLYDAEERTIRDKSVQLWLKELRELAEDAEYVLGEYMYEVYRAQVEARNASELNPVKGDPEQSVIYSVQIPHGMVDRIRDIKSRFEEIAEDREALCLREEDAPRRHCNERKHIPTSPLVVENSVFGREVDKEKVIDLLLSDYNQGKSISVLPIVGKGGLGKTTLAQLVYNDKRVQKSFDMSGWVCVSDDFNIERIARHLIESLTRTGCDLTSPSFLLEELANKITGKKVFLVLDDVWNEEPGLWELLRTPLMKATKAAILVTTRNVSVARIMQTMKPLQLAYLPSDKCWLLFTHYAFQGKDLANHSSLVKIGKKIVKKCGGFPLAVKLIASLLRHEAEDQSSWLEILQSDLWELSAGKEILAPLRISYERLPMYLKPCLVLCSMFPKDYMYDIGPMGRLWIANGYIEPKERKDPEEVAADYAKELYERSFFDDFKTYDFGTIYNDIPLGYSHGYEVTTFRLHDLIHDLAWLNSEKMCYSVEQGFSKEICHLYLKEDFNKPYELSSINTPILQTLVFRSRSPHPFFCFDGLSKTECLRALDLEYFSKVKPLPLGHLKHLRYLSLRGPCITHISPKFIFSCYSLRTLMLDLWLCDMEILGIELPGIGNLINLELLVLEASMFPVKLPESLGFLSKLRVLELHGSWFAELPECIGNLAELNKIVISKTTIKILPKSFCRLTNLKKLLITNCIFLEELPEDFGNLTSLEFLWLKRCPRIYYLPQSCTKLVPRCTMNIFDLNMKPDKSYGVVGWLKEWKNLKGILGIKNIQNILALKDAKNANFVGKRNLETLLLDWSNSWSSDILPNEYSTEKGILGISICNSIDHKYPDVPDYNILENFQPHPNLKHLYICNYRGLEFPRWIGDPLSCSSLVKLCIRGCSYVSFLPLGKVLSLKELHISKCSGLLHLKMESLPSQLEHLTIYSCVSLVEVALLQSLIKLDISSCFRLKSLLMADQQSSELKSLLPLKKMTIKDCPFVKANQLLLGEDCAIYISGCPNLEDWCLRHNFKYDPCTCYKEYV